MAGDTQPDTNRMRIRTSPIQTFLILVLLAILLSLVGCAHGPTKRESTPSVAFVSTQKAKLHIEKAKTAVARIAVPEAKRVEEALDMAEEELDVAGNKIIALQDQMKEVAQAKEDAESSALRAENAKRFWRSWALRLGSVAAMLGVWVFRKPLLALCGVPVI